MKVSTILDQIDLGSIALPEFQRGYVWNRDQVRGLMDSLYRRHPVGSLLVWLTKTEGTQARGDGHLSSGTVKLLLDGQQRITTLYGIVLGKQPRFFDGNAENFTGLHFHLEEEVFAFYAPLKMKDNPLWVDVTRLMQVGVGNFIGEIVTRPELASRLNVYLARLTRLGGIVDIDLHIEEVTGEDKTVDVVVEIFNRLNSGGTKLSKGDLALAKICAAWPEARDEMKARLDRWQRAGFYFRLEWLLRCINATVTGEALFSALKDVEVPAFQQGLQTAGDMVDRLLDMIASRLGLDHDRVLGSRYSFPLLVRYLAERGGKPADYRERDKLLYWYVQTFLWGRYAGSTETVLNVDLGAIEQKDGALDRLIQQLRQDRGDLTVSAQDFWGWSRGARFYPLLYMMTRVSRCRDWGSGLELSASLLGRYSRLEVHHIFPKALLYRHDYSRPEVNSIANFTFLTRETNEIVTDRDPAEYFEEVQRRYPGALESHWIPIDRKLWKVENYNQFLEARRELLAEAANRFLQGLLEGALPEPEKSPSILDRDVPVVLSQIESDDEERLLRDCNAIIARQGLVEGELLYELADPDTGELLAVLDLAWPEGLQPGLTQPIAILINETAETVEVASAAGFRCFTEIESFLNYVAQEIPSTTLESAVEERGGARKAPRFTPARFNDACAERVQKHLGRSLIKEGKARWKTADGSLAVLCAVSRAYPNAEGESYWHIYKPQHGKFLESAAVAYVALGCSSPETVLLIPHAEFIAWLDGLGTTVTENGPYWHLQVFNTDGHLTLVRKRGYEPVDLDRYLL
jgi:5-methylcytosine-specific restriction endonuclease McrA